MWTCRTATRIPIRNFAASSTRSTSGKKSTTTRDNRIAGRLRFYKLVDVKQVEAPWKTTGDTDDATTVVQSPIPAGVDGTDSASGVHRPKFSSSATPGSNVVHMLTPRAPGSPTTSHSQSTSTPTPTLSSSQWYGVTLDGRTVQTPMGQKLAVPSERLAYMIAAEWDSQGERLRPVNMPLMTLACTALDQVAYHPDVYREQSLRFLPTDTTCFWADPTEDRLLHRRQEEAWKELHKFVEQRLNHPPCFALGAHEAMLMSRKRGDIKPTTGLPHPPDLIRKATEWTHSLDAWHLASFASICSQSKSFLVAWAMMEPESPFTDLQKAIAASRVEEEFQISNWGLVEGGHDYDRLNCSIQLYSAHVFAKAIAMDNHLS